MLICRRPSAVRSLQAAPAGVLVLAPGQVLCHQNMGLGALNAAISIQHLRPEAVPTACSCRMHWRFGAVDQGVRGFHGVKQEVVLPHWLEYAWKQASQALLLCFKEACELVYLLGQQWGVFR